MEIEESRKGAVTVLRPIGPLVGEDAELLRTRASVSLNESLGRVVIDGSAVAYVDSQGLEALLDVGERTSSGGRLLKLCGLNDTVRQALELTELAPGFDFYEDVNSAVRSFL